MRYEMWDFKKVSSHITHPTAQIGYRFIIFVALVDEELMLP